MKRSLLNNPHAIDTNNLLTGVGALLLGLAAVLKALRTYKSDKPEDQQKGEKRLDGTLGEKVNCKEDVDDKNWEKIAKASKNKDGVVALFHKIHSKYEGNKLVDCTVIVDYIAIGSRIRKNVTYPLPLVLQLPGSTIDGVRQSVEVSKCDAAEDFKDKYVQQVHGANGIRELTFRFPNGITSTKPSRLCFVVTFTYQPENLYQTISRDIAVSAKNWAIRKLVASVEFSNDCLPEAVPSPRVTDHDSRRITCIGNVTSVDINKYESTYYGVYRQAFSYGLDWDWLDKSLNYEKEG
jgi:hypothetical protein